MTGRWWSVGELARACGVTVRALHHYDAIGLVRPSGRTPAGHRRYTGADVRRLYRVRALQELGLSLEEIGTTLDAPGGEPGGAEVRQLLVAQLAGLDAQAKAIAERRARIQGLLDRVDGPDAPEPGEFLAALERTVHIVRPESYLTAVQRGALAEQAATLGEEAVSAYRTEWLELLRGLCGLMNESVPPDDPRVRDRARRWREIGIALRGPSHDDEQINVALAGAWRDNKALIDQGLTDRVPGLAAGDLVRVMDYVQQARNAEAGA